VAERVVFTLPDAERIAKAVRRVEGGNRDEAPLRFRKVDTDRARNVFRIGTFSGNWGIGATSVVTFKYVTTTPNTVVARNLFWPLDNNGGIVDCSIAREGTSWFLITPQIFSAQYFTAAETSVECGIDFKALVGLCLETGTPVVVNMPVPTVEVVTSVTMTSSAIVFARREVGVICNNSGSEVSIPITTCATATS